MKTVTWISKDWMAIEDRPAVVISIGDPGESLPEFGNNPPDVLRIECHDIPDGVSISDLDGTYRQFDWHMARKILQFEHQYREHDIIVHCHAGISRSCAVALYLSDHCGRLLDVSRPCIGQIDMQNKWIYRQLGIAHLDLACAENVHPLVIGGKNV